MIRKLWVFNLIGRFKCEYCNIFLTGGLMPGTWKCRAFPDGIPEVKPAFITGDPCIDCNNGIGFEPEKKEKSPSDANNAE